MIRALVSKRRRHHRTQRKAHQGNLRQAGALGPLKEQVGQVFHAKFGSQLVVITQRRQVDQYHRHIKEYLFNAVLIGIEVLEGTAQHDQRHFMGIFRRTERQVLHAPLAYKIRLGRLFERGAVIDLVGYGHDSPLVGRWLKPLLVVDPVPALERHHFRRKAL